MSAFPTSPRASRSSDSRGAAGSAISRSCRCRSQPRRRAFSPQALSTRVRQMASAAAAKQWPRPSNCWSPTRRRYASRTRGGGVEAVAGGLGRESGGGEFAQLVIEEGEEVGGLAVGPGGGFEHSGNVGHSASVPVTAGSGLGNLPRRTLPKNPLRAPVSSTYAPKPSRPARLGPTGSRRFLGAWSKARDRLLKDSAAPRLSKHLWCPGCTYR
jgi:hypothetical protein